jgi:Uma2 family endonuclease
LPGYFESVKLRASDDIFYYPDIMVACDPDDEPFYETGPCLLVEVTSPSTESIDRREKLVVYKSIPFLKAYLIVEQNRRVVERYWRNEEGEWAALYNEGSVPVPCPETTLALQEIYAGLE